MTFIINGSFLNYIYFKLLDSFFFAVKIQFYFEHFLMGT